MQKIWYLAKLCDLAFIVKIVLQKSVLCFIIFICV